MMHTTRAGKLGRWARQAFRTLQSHRQRGGSSRAPAGEKGPEVSGGTSPRKTFLGRPLAPTAPANPPAAARIRVPGWTPKEKFNAALRRFGPFTSAEEAHAKLQPIAFQMGGGGGYPHYWAVTVGSYRRPAPARSDTGQAHRGRSPGHQTVNEFVHRIVLGVKIGRALRPGEHVHHIDRNPSHNHPGNLVLVHASDHKAAERGTVGGTWREKNGALRLSTRRKPFLARVIAERVLRRRLPRSWFVVRRDGDPTNDAPDNLAVVHIRYMPSAVLKRIRPSLPAITEAGWDAYAR